MLDEKGKVTLKWWRHELHEHGERLSRICGDIFEITKIIRALQGAGYTVTPPPVATASPA